MTEQIVQLKPVCVEAMRLYDFLERLIPLVQSGYTLNKSNALFPRKTPSRLVAYFDPPSPESLNQKIQEINDHAQSILVNLNTTSLQDDGFEGVGLTPEDLNLACEAINEAFHLDIEQSFKMANGSEVAYTENTGEPIIGVEEAVQIENTQTAEQDEAEPPVVEEQPFKYRAGPGRPRKHKR